MALRPIVAICGTTGVGKSRLAIDLALHIKKCSHKSGWREAKIINADAMQVYQGLDVITNKTPEAERQGIPHMLIDFKQPGEQYVVGEWVQDALSLIDEMHENHQLPIIVGGTSYWIQHLLFPNRLVSSYTGASLESDSSLKQAISCLPAELQKLLEVLPKEAPSAKLNPDEAFQLYTVLSSLDPVMSERWHWKDSRKVLRSLQILKETCRRPSDILIEQSSLTTNVPRFRALCFWLYADLKDLGERLDCRVDEMISRGLLDEIRRLREMSNARNDEPSEIYSHGIYQSIGYKEFCTYLDAPTKNSFAAATERMKISTRQYAKRQISWIRNKLKPAVDAANCTESFIPFYLLDASRLEDSAWLKNICHPAIRIKDAFLASEMLPDPKTLSSVASELLDLSEKDINPISVLQARKRRICQVCTVQQDRPVMIEEGKEWKVHQSTRSHKRLASRLNGEE